MLRHVPPFPLVRGLPILDSGLCCRPVIQIVPLLSREVRNERTLREHKAER